MNPVSRLSELECFFCKEERGWVIALNCVIPSVQDSLWRLLLTARIRAQHRSLQRLGFRCQAPVLAELGQVSLETSVSSKL